MTSLRQLRVAAVLTVAGLAIPLFWLIRRFFTHHPPGAGVALFLLTSAAVATLACAGAVGLAVPILVRDPTLRTPARIASSIAAALTALCLLTFWVFAFARTPGLLNFVLFLGLPPTITTLLLVGAV